MCCVWRTEIVNKNSTKKAKKDASRPGHKDPEWWGPVIPKIKTSVTLWLLGPLYSAVDIRDRLPQLQLNTRATKHQTTKMWLDGAGNGGKQADKWKWKKKTVTLPPEPTSCSTHNQLSPPPYLHRLTKYGNACPLLSFYRRKHLLLSLQVVVPFIMRTCCKYGFWGLEFHQQVLRMSTLSVASDGKSGLVWDDKVRLCLCGFSCVVSGYRFHWWFIRTRVRSQTQVWED